jgi:Tfp pilus assembly protein PilX
MENKSLLANEDGSIILIVLMVLMLVTLMGVSSINTSTIEMQIAANEKGYKKNFYVAEAAVMEGLQRMDLAPAEDLKLNQSTTLSWINTPNYEVDVNDATDVATHAGAASTGSSIYYASNQGFTTGTSLGMTGPSQLYTFEVHGVLDRGTGGRSHIEVGYKRRF